MRAEEIHPAIRILRKEILQWQEPILGVVAKESRDPFRVLIACVLSLRTKDKTTADASRRLFALAHTPRAMLKLPLRRIEKAIYPVGFYRNKARQIKDICRRLLSDYKGRVPDSIEELLTLNGVGRKTANLTVTVGYNKPGICVDIHVHRISNRWGYVKTKTPAETEEALRRKLPEPYWITYNDLLVPYGQNLCQPVSPWCSKCKLVKYCDQVGVTRSR
ncbi:MAG: endonuclease III [Nitrospirae bacterium RIFCSPLOWO2_12_FULL_63_8]|nr:MAG: endonuclease III [Nitrospirae bacterium RIFCSPLOWO2_12_FULL_63_8]